jgi:hypothetical protein
LTSEDYSVENVIFEDDLTAYFGFYYDFFYYWTFPFLPNWIDGTLLGYLWFDTIVNISLSKILPSGPVPSI